MTLLVEVVVDGRVGLTVITDERLIDAAIVVVGHRILSEGVNAGGVAAALIADHGDVFVGVCIEAERSMGFCAKHAAISAMISAVQSRIATIVAVAGEYLDVVPPSGPLLPFTSTSGCCGAARRTDHSLRLQNQGFVG